MSAQPLGSDAMSSEEGVPYGEADVVASEAEFEQAQEYVSKTLVDMSRQAWYAKIAQMTAQQRTKVNAALDKVNGRQILASDEVRVLVDYLQPIALSMKLPVTTRSAGDDQRPADESRIRNEINSYNKKYNANLRLSSG